MKPLGYRYKLLLSFTGIFAVFAIVMVLFEMHYERGLRVKDFRNHMRDYADMVAREIHQTGDTISLENMREFLVCLPREVRFTIIDRKGNVVYESNSENAHIDGNHSNRPEIVRAIKVADGAYDVRHSATFNTDYFYFAKTYGKKGIS